MILEKAADMTGRWIAAAVVTLACALVPAWPRATAAQGAPPAAGHPVGIRQLEFVDQDRHLALAVFYPAVVRDGAAVPFVMPFFDKLKTTAMSRSHPKARRSRWSYSPTAAAATASTMPGSPNSWPRAV